MPLGQLRVGLADLLDGVGRSDGHDQFAGGHELGELGEHARGAGLGPSDGLGPELLGGGEVDDGLDPPGRDSEPNRELDVAAG